MLNNIIWLASYPKSGNTWFRLFLTALKSGEGDFDINVSLTDGIFSGKFHFEDTLDIDSDILQLQEIQHNQSLVWNYISTKAKSKLFVKIHDAFGFLPDFDNRSLVPEEATYKALYFVRNPFDVVPSLANHNGDTIEQTVHFLNNAAACFSNPKKKKNSAAAQFYQHLGIWNDHVKSWLIHPNFPVLFLRYEDMKMNSFETFKKAVEFLELPYTDEQIKQALALTAFDKLRKEEESKGFKEKSSHAKFFFNKGEINYGKSLLTEEQIETIKTANEEMMQHFGYWH